MKRIILHIDMDYFFAQVEERENPHFKGRPIVIGADPKKGKGRGVVSTANYIAREYGIHSALPISQAFKFCPKAVFLPPDMKLYVRASESIFEIIKKYSSIYEMASLDEAYLDISFLENYRKAEKLARELKNEIFKKEKLTSSIGLGPNKLIAKLAAQKEKPDGLFAVKPDQVIKFLEPLDIQELPGIGPKTAQRLRRLKINKIKDIKRLSRLELKEMLGKWGEDIYNKVRGIDEGIVNNDREVKSIGRGHTFERDTRDPEIIFEIFGRIIEKVHKEILANDFSFRTITVTCRFSDFKTYTKAKTFKKSTNDYRCLKKESKRLLLKFIVENLKLIRLIGLRVSGLNHKK